MAAAEDCSILDPAAFTPARFPARVPLGPDCWSECALARVISQGKEILLTPREDPLLRLLLEAPEALHQTGDLAVSLAKRCGVAEVSLQSVRQTILGPRDPRIAQRAANP